MIRRRMEGLADRRCRRHLHLRPLHLHPHLRCLRPATGAANHPPLQPVTFVNNEQASPTMRISRVVKTWIFATSSQMARKIGSKVCLGSQKEELDAFPTKCEIPSGRSRGLILLPQDFRVVTGNEVALCYTYNSVYQCCREKGMKANLEFGKPDASLE